MTKLRLAVVGAGRLGRFHARLLAAMPDVALVAVADPVKSAREEVAAECATQPVADYRELIGKVEGVVVATPTVLHHSVGLFFLQQGVAAMIEKPLAASLAEADELVRAARESRATLQVGHVERFNPALAAAAPYLGVVKYFEAVRAGAFTFRSTDIGVVLDLMIHDLDIAMALAASPVAHVDALGLSFLGRHEDVAQARLEFESGCVANLSASRVSAATNRRTQIWSDRGLAVVDYDRRTVSVTCPSEAVRRREIDVERMAIEERDRLKDRLLAEHLPTTELTVEPRNAIGDELADFVSAIRGERAPRVPGEQGRDVIAVAEQVIARIHSTA